MRIEEENVIFGTGRTLYANCGIIGIGPGDDDGVCGGYDDHLLIAVKSKTVEGKECLSVEECHELADHMIERWTRFREQCILRKYRA